MTKHLNRDVVALRSRKNKPTKKGFTLTEMLVVVMVVAVLAAIAYPLYTKASTKSRAIEAINLLEMVRNKQLQKYAASRAYYTSFDNMGQLTSNKKNEVISGQQLKVKDYTLSLNNVHSCMTATYEKGRTKFSFSSSYEYTGLGCTGDVCSSFGDIVGTAKDVCNCGSKTCTNGYTLNEDTCNCDCYLGCNQGGTCFAPYGGGQTRACSTGCGTQSSTASCSGPVWSGSCWSPTQTQATSMTCTTGCGTQTRTCTATCSGGTCGSWNTSACYTKTQTLPTSRSCGNSGTQTRTCTATCSGGSCGAWGTCTGQTCPTSSKPTTSQACGNCGTQTRSVTCNTNTGTWTTGSWGTCSNQGVCASGATQSCNSTGTQTCSSTCTWGTCSVVSCNESSKPSESQSCGNCNTGTQTRTVTCNTSTGTWTTGTWGTCTGGGTCAPGATQSCNTSGTQTCSSTCTWGTCSVVSCNESSKPSESQSCGNCNTGTQTRTVTCNTSTGTWTTGTWGTCTGGGACAPGDTKLAMCGTNTGYNQGGTEQFIYQNLTCTSSCTWPAVTPCNNCVESPNCGKFFANGTVGACYCMDTPVAVECPSSMPIDFQDCGNCGTQTRTVTCNYETGIWETSSWGTCSNQGVCAVGATQSCGGGNGTQTCSSSCAWNTCVCKSGYTLSGGTCVASATANIISTTVLVDEGPRYTMCLPGTADRTQYGIDSSRCSARTTQSTCYNDYLVSGDPNIATCTTISMSACPSTNYQSLCNQYGRGYKCRISASGTPNRVDYCMCDWYGSYCGEASGLSCTYTYLTASGSGSYLSCE